MKCPIYLAHLKIIYGSKSDAIAYCILDIALPTIIITTLFSILYVKLTKSIDVYRKTIREYTNSRASDRCSFGEYIQKRYYTNTRLRLSHGVKNRLSAKYSLDFELPSIRVLNWIIIGVANVLKNVYGTVCTVILIYNPTISTTSSTMYTKRSRYRHK